MIEMLVCVALLGQPVETESCVLTQTTERRPVYCAWISAATLSKGKARVTFCSQSKGRIKPDTWRA